MNYTQLKQTIIDYTENTDSEFEAEVPTFVRLAEQRIYNSVLIPNLRRNVTGNAYANNRYLQTPTDFLSVYEISVIKATGKYETMLQKEVSYLREAYPDPSVVGTPRYYAFFDDDTFIMAPTPDQAYTIELHYYYYPESIVDNGTSWLGDNFDMVLLYGALVEAANFMKADADIVAGYGANYDKYLFLLKNYADGRVRNDEYRNYPNRTPVMN